MKFLPLAFAKSLKAKLVILAVSVSFVALAVFMTYSLWASYNDARGQRLNYLRTLMEFTAFNLEAPLAFNDKEAAETLLASLQFEKSIELAQFVSNNPELTVEFRRSASNNEVFEVTSETAQGPGEILTFDHIILYRPVSFEGAELGTLFVCSSLDDLIALLKQSVFRAMLVLGACLGLAVLLAGVLQKIIIKPISAMLSTMQEIAAEKNYSRRLRVFGEDEFAALMARFNEMLVEIEKRDNTLESEVRLRTEELREALVAAKAASEAKSQFLANMSHEMRTPLNGIIGMTSLLQEMLMTSEEADLVDLVASSADTLLSVINDVLDFSKIEQGKIEIESRNFQFQELSKAIKSTTGFQAEEKGITFVEHSEVPSDLEFRGDPLRIQQVLINLVGNALKFTSAGGAIIFTAWLEQTSENLGRLHFAVVDTGVGIAGAKQKLIFDSFTQADGSVTREYGGTGLGLAISRQLVQLMGGRIKVESKSGVGSCFSFYVTVAIVDNNRRDEQEAEGQVAPMIPLENLRVLVAEDNPVNQRLAQRLLESERHQVTIAQDGREATDLVREHDFDIILMDVQMPVMDGLEATRAIRSMEGQKGRVPILGVSAHAFREYRERSVSTGMSGYVAKPFKKKELLEAMQQVLMNAQNSSETKNTPD